MAIDPKELRIGSHVNANGVRARVIDIHNKLLRPDYNYQIFVEGISPEDGEKKVVGAMVHYLEPIPITPELLTELGLLKMEEHGSVSVWMNRNIRIDIIGERITAMVGNDYNKCTISPIRYLHELESFLYLTTKQELLTE